MKNKKRYAIRITFGRGYSVYEKSDQNQYLGDHPILQIVDRLDKKVYCFSLTTASETKFDSMCECFRIDAYRLHELHAKKVRIDLNGENHIQYVRHLNMSARCAVIDLKYTNIAGNTGKIIFDSEKYRIDNYNSVLRKALELILSETDQIICYNGNVDDSFEPIGERHFDKDNQSLPEDIYWFLDELLHPDYYDED